MSARGAFWVGLALLICYPATSASATIRFVRSNAPSGGNGQSWATAYTSIVTAMSSATNGDQVWVAAGTYGGNFPLNFGVQLYGGFAGTETQLSQRNWKVNLTIIDAAGGYATTGWPNATATTRIDGFYMRNAGSGAIICTNSSPTIANNIIVGNSNSNTSNGGGITCTNSSPTLIDDVIVGNGAGNGGAIYGTNSSPTIINCTIAANTAITGGGLYFTGGSPLVVNTVITANNSGVFISGGTPVLRNCCVYANGTNFTGITDPTGSNGNISVDPRLAATGYGNIHLQPGSPCIDAGDSSAVPAGSVDVDLQPRISGAAVDIGADEADGTNWQAGPYAIVRVSPSGNDANDGATWASAKRTIQAAINQAALLGGEVWVQAGSYNELVTGRPFVYLYGGFAGTETDRGQRNWRTHISLVDGGGGLNATAFVRGGWRVNTIDGFVLRNGSSGLVCSGYSGTIANNLITANNTGSGGGIFCINSKAVISNNLIVSNGANLGGGLYLTNSQPTIVNNTIASNAATTGGGIHCVGSAPLIVNTLVTANSSGVFADPNSQPVLRNDCVYGNTNGNFSGLTDPTGSNGNISVDPQLASIGYSNLHLEPGSPCIDAGDSSAVVSSTDFDGLPRLNGNAVDLGAYESDGTQWPAGPYAIVRVSPTGDDAQDGATWASAKRTVQAAVDAAAAVGGDVWVQAGTYAQRLFLRPYSYVYGGFNGTESTLSQRDYYANISVLDGGASGTVVLCSSGWFVSRLDGLTLQNGSSAVGGGIYCSRCAPVIANNVICYNHTSSSTGAGGKGSGIYCTRASPSIVNNLIFGNNGDGYGGGIYCDTATPFIFGNRIVGNALLDNGVIVQGGGIYCTSSSPTILNNTIAGNTAMDGGGIYCNNSSPLIQNSIVAFNSQGAAATGSGGPLFRNDCVFSNGGYDFIGVSNPTGANGNIAADPLLAGILNGDVHLQPGSPCIDAGDSSLVPAGTTDCDGQPRIMGARVDMGADESDGTLWAPQPQVRIHVSPSGNDAADGRSWATAKRTVQGGLAAFATTSGELWVQAGTYVEHVVLPEFVQMYGGFNGSETTRDQRNPQANLTVLDGGSVDGYIVTSKQASYTSVLDGFTLAHAGNPNSNSTAAIYLYYSAPTISNNVLTSNYASYSSGVLNCSYASPSVIGNTFTANYASAVYCWNAAPLISHNTFQGGQGWAITATSSAPIVEWNQLAGNAAGISWVTCTGAIRDNVFDHAFHIDCNTNSVLTLLRNRFYGCTGDYGGAFQSMDSTGLILNNQFISSYAIGDGGAIRWLRSSATMANNLFADNRTSGHGGAVLCENANVTLINNTMVGNTAQEGGALYVTNGTVIIGNALIAGNGSGVFKNSGASVAFTNCCVYGNPMYDFSGLPSPIGSNGNFAADPLLASSAYGNMHLQPGSPCIDAGLGTLLQAGWTDLDGAARVVGEQVDIGADESDGTIWSPGPYTTIRVSPTGNDGNDGTTWASAKRTVQAGITAAAVAGGDVWVAAGTYHEHLDVKPFVHLFGGFAGMETSREQRNWTSNVTTLDGSGNGQVVTIMAGESASTLDGFTVRNGNFGTGTGIYCRFASPAIRNNIITSNLGSGLYFSSSNALVYGNLITKNPGGGVYLETGREIFVANRFLQNKGSWGGGLNCLNSTLTFFGNVLDGNVITDQGAGMYCKTSTGVVAGNVFVGNVGTYGPAIYLDTSPVTFTNNTVVSNKAYYDGAVNCSNSAATLANNIVVRNSSGIYAGGTSLPLELYDCVHGNTAYDYRGSFDPNSGVGDVAADPNFVRLPSIGPDNTWGTADDDYGDLRLEPGSVGIDAGANSLVAPDSADLNGNGNRSERMPFDVAGMPRIEDDPATVDSGAGSPPLVDIGAYEFQMVLIGDINNDGVVNLSDLAQLLANYAVTGATPEMGDVNGDHIVDLSDLAALLANFGKTK